MRNFEAFREEIEKEKTEAETNAREAQLLVESKSEKNADFTFDGVYFENIAKIGAFPPIINLKNARKQSERKVYDDCIRIIKNEHPQLLEFM